MDDAQRFSVLAGAAIALAIALASRRHGRGLLLATSAVGAAAGGWVFPRLLGLVLGYRAAAASVAASPGRFWRTELRELTAFYTMAPAADTVPRGMAVGLLAGLVVGLVWSGRRRRSRRPAAPGEPRPTDHPQMGVGPG